MSDLSNHSDLTPLKAIDANLNRANEALRTLEDSLRYDNGRAALISEIKQFRHTLSTIFSGNDVLGPDDLLSARNVIADTGTTVTTEVEYYRTTRESILTANCKRLQQSLRSLEEFTKLFDTTLSKKIESLRYKSYRLEQKVHLQKSRLTILNEADLFLLVDTSDDLSLFEEKISTLLNVGIRLFQLRDKLANDQQLFKYGAVLREQTEAANALFIVNDRPDLARLLNADGVHLGQEDLTPLQARKLLLGDQLVGLSTHDQNQLKQSKTQQVDYLGIGPTFPSKTKSFDQFPGKSLLKKAFSETEKPLFAIGGITTDNLPELLKIGTTAGRLPKIALHQAIWKEKNYAQKGEQFLTIFSQWKEKHTFS
ncbi:MAG: thiamine phosphate synthase [Pirellulaceae bacterium]|nr:thiamine phosphate synthase [Pirellulaceae bacterium]